MRSAVKQIGICAVVLLVFCLGCRLWKSDTYTAYIPMNPGLAEAYQQGELQVKSELPEVLLAGGDLEQHKDYFTMPIDPESRGTGSIEFLDRNGETLAFLVMRVGRFNTVFDVQTGGFTGDTAILIAVTLFWLYLSAVMVWNYRQAKGPAFYSYYTIYFAGFSIFSLVTGILMAYITVLHIIDPFDHNMMEAYNTIAGASKQFMLLTNVLVVIFAGAMIVSNIVLLRHQKPSVKNALGILIGLMLIGGELLGVYWFSSNFSGSHTQKIVLDTAQNIYATLFVYFECMLAGSVICGVNATQNQPSRDQDFIIILGCWFRKDGTLPPLLRDRVDQAVSFWKQQQAETGKEAILIPSGGQGKDEPMPEAEAMRLYAISQGIADEYIRPETQSKNTFQNMAYSKQIMDSIDPEGKAIFATTSYHVFRSGVWAANAGLHIEGIGSKTKWWYWPNAFMRECIGLLQKRWKQETFLLILLIAFFGALSIILG